MTEINYDHVICPQCCHSFRAIPENVQRELRAGEAAAKERDELHNQLAAFTKQLCVAAQEREKYRFCAVQFCGAHIGNKFDECPACRADRLAKIVTNAEAGDCLRGELGTVECPVDRPCGVCELTRERDAALERERRLREDVTEARWIIDHAAAPQNVGKLDDINQEWRERAYPWMARTAPQSDAPQPAPARPMPVETFAEAPKPIGELLAEAGTHYVDPKTMKPAEAPKPPPADEPALRELYEKYTEGYLVRNENMMARAILELARRPR